MASRLILACVAVVSMLAAPVGAVGKKAEESWGKAGISFEQYRADALECANRAYGVEPEVKPYGPVAFDTIPVPAANWLSLEPGRVPVYTTTYAEGYRHAMWMDVVEQLQATVDRCLAARGYSKFRLTAAQMARLRRLPRGSAERQAFLYSLGSDARVVASQAVRNG